MALLAIATVSALLATHGRLFPPHGNPLVYAVAMSWLISISAVLPATILFRGNVKRFALAGWEKDGDVYDRKSVRAFKWMLLHSPLGWINPNLHMTAGRADCDRLLREMNVGEGVHWLTCLLSSALAIQCLASSYAAYGYILLLLRVPFDLYPIMLQRWNRGRVSRVLEIRHRGKPDRTS